MKLESWVLFIDMLGYGELNSKISNDQEANRFLDFMKSNEKIFSQQDREEIKNEYKTQVFDLYKYYEIQTTFISDSLIINYKPKDVDEDLNEKLRILHSANALFVIMNRIQTYIYNCLARHNILVRGGISNKYCLVKNNYGVGEGLIDAYINESKRAKYPRIVLSKNIMDNEKLINSFNLICSNIYGVETFLKEDGDNIYYLDYLKYSIRTIYTTMLGRMDGITTINGYLKNHKETIELKLKEIERKISSSKDPNEKPKNKNIKDKLIWIKDYHNICVEKALPHFKIVD